MGVDVISGAEFNALISRRSELLFKVSRFLEQRQSCKQPLTRPLLGDLLFQATQLEELLDAYGAKNNCQWHFFRSLVAAIKLFSNVSYELLHIQHALPVYRLLAVQKDFAIDTDKALKFTNKVLLGCTRHILDQTTRLGVSLPSETTMDDIYRETLPPGRLAQDLSTRKVETVAKTVTLLATAFLNLAADSKHVLPCRCKTPDNCSDYATCQTSEESLRSLELKFHNLQSLYDTYVSKTETEGMDADLPVLRGHISVVFHLLRVATEFAHYYERHVENRQMDSSTTNRQLVDAESLLSMLTSYAISYASRFLNCAEKICQEMLKRYSEIGKIDVLVPQYRGFHVRPSTLIAKLVWHYGSNVTMLLGDETYDAGSPLELFRANEKINAWKRHSLAREIVKLEMLQDSDGRDVEDVIRDVVMMLAKQSKLIVYEHPIRFQCSTLSKEVKLLEHVTDAIAKLLATGTIDIVTDMKVTFVGDKRVLNDIKLLAEAGYGEDNHGNNIPLSKNLKYLRK